jgi:adenylate cyclase
MSSPDQLNRWLISEGRMLGDATAIVEHYCNELLRAGVPLARARIAQSYSNPLLSAWGTIWTRSGTNRYAVAANVLSTSAWQGSPFEHVVTTRTCLRKKLSGRDLAAEHAVYAELAGAGATDFLAMPLEYGDGSVQGASFTTDAVSGFTDASLELIEGTRHALAAALEPIAMRESQKSLLQTYLGQGPAEEIGQGYIKRGESKSVPAAILFADLRGFTLKSQTWPEGQLLEMMGDYFEMVVEQIQEHGGDVLKFMGDGILAVFADEKEARRACKSAVEAARQALVSLERYNSKDGRNGREHMEFVIGIDFGQVTFGNIGSPDRLDFTVVGRAVNVASRVQGLCKDLGEPLLMTANVARHLGRDTRPAGFHSIRGVPEQIEIFKALPIARGE